MVCRDACIRRYRAQLCDDRHRRVLDHDASVGYFDSPTINTIIAIFLLISGCNYGLHFSLLSGRSLKVYWRDPEFRMFIGVQLTLVIICTVVLWFHDVYNSALTTLNQAFFQVVSMATTAGFTTDSIARWPLFLPVLLLCSAFIGGCAGSTGGGLKVIRILLLFKQGNRELKRLVHPNAVYSIKLGNRACRNVFLKRCGGSSRPMRWSSSSVCWRLSRRGWMISLPLLPS